METLIFHWTGVAVIWALCISVGGVIISVLLIAPLVAYKRAKLFLWQWKYAAILASTGFTQDDVEFAAGYADRPKNTSLEDLLRWVREVKTRGDARKAGSGKLYD